MIDLIIRNGKIVSHINEKLADVAIKNGKIFKIGKLANLKSKKTIDAKGLHILPGAFDTQVHFREPGNTIKENLKTGSLAAIAGGITSVFDNNLVMPILGAEELLQMRHIFYFLEAILFLLLLLYEVHVFFSYFYWLI